MNKVRCKFFVAGKVLSSASTETEKLYDIQMSAVIDGSDENKEFFKWTPSGTLNFSTVNEGAAESIEQGKQYYIDITPCE